MGMKVELTVTVAEVTGRAVTLEVRAATTHRPDLPRPAPRFVVDVAQDREARLAAKASQGRRLIAATS